MGLKILLLLFIILVIGQSILRILAKTHPVPCPFEVAWILENPIRKRFFAPQKILDRIGITPGERILELGPGPGFFTLEASKRVGDSGRLYCADIQAEMIEAVRHKGIEEGVSNVRLVVSDGCRLPFKGGMFDRAFLITVLGEIPHRRQALSELHFILRGGGSLSVTEFLPDPHYVSRRTTRFLGEKAGFVFEERIGNLFQYTANFVKA